MTNKIITSQFQHMDFKSHSYAFSFPKEELTVLWKKKLPEPSNRTFLKWFCKGVFLMNSPHGFMRITNEGLTEVSGFKTPVYQLYPSFNSAPIVVSDIGDLYRIQPDFTMNSKIKSGVLASMVTPIGLSDEKIVVLKKRKDWLNYLPWESKWIIECVNENTKNKVWSKKQFFNSFLPTSRGVLITYSSNPNKLMYLDHHGNLIWEKMVHDVIDHIVGIVNDKVWMCLDDGTFTYIQMSTGKILNTIKISEARNPLCILDEKARIIICNGISITIIDALEGNIISQKSITINGKYNSSTTHGNRVLLTKDDYVIYADYHNRIFMIHLYDNEPGVFLWEASERIRGITIASGELIVLFGKHIVSLKNKSIVI